MTHSDLVTVENRRRSGWSAKLATFGLPLLAAVAAVLVIAGIVSIHLAHTWPVYEPPDTPQTVTREFVNKYGSAALPEHTEEWFSRLDACMTPHIRYADRGDGLVALGLGLGLVALLGWGHARRPGFRNRGTLLTIWVAAWLMRIPLSAVMYGQRELRGEYPPWSDSIAIPIIEESLMAVAGMIATGVVLFFLLGRRRFEPALRYQRPATAQGWARDLLLAAWFFLLLFIAIDGIPAADMGSAFGCVTGAYVLLIALTSPPWATESLKRSLNSDPQPEHSVQ